MEESKNKNRQIKIYLQNIFFVIMVGIAGYYVGYYTTTKKYYQEELLLRKNHLEEMERIHDQHLKDLKDFASDIGKEYAKHKNDYQ